MLGDDLRTWLSSPLVAIVLGVLAGSCLAYLNRYGIGFTTPDDESGLGMAVTLGLFTVGLILAVALMFGYNSIAPSAIAPFGSALAGSLIVVTVLSALPQLRATRAGTKRR